MDAPKSPSKSRYAAAEAYVFVAEASNFLEEFIAEVVAGIIAALGTPVAGILARVIEQIVIAIVEIIVFDIPILIITGDKTLKHNGLIIEGASHRITTLERKMAFSRARYASALRTARRIPFLRPSVNKIALKFSGMRSFVKKSAFGRLWKSMGLDLIPFVDFWPFRLLAVRKQYKLSLEAYELAIEAQRELGLMEQQAAELQKQIQEANTYETPEDAPEEEAESQERLPQQEKPPQEEGDMGMQEPSPERPERAAGSNVVNLRPRVPASVAPTRQEASLQKAA